jgi:hypothetical protein
MTDKTQPLYDNFSFFTQSVTAGHDKKGKPLWKRIIEYDKNGLPHWTDWNGVRDSIIRPLCDQAKSVTIWYEWRSDRPELLQLKKFVEENVQKQGRYCVAIKPTELIYEPLFWTGGGREFTVVQVIGFDLDKLEYVLNCLTRHRQAGKKSPRYGPIFDRVNRFAKASVKQGGFAVIVTGGEAEIFVPLDCKERTEKVARDVDALHTAEMGWD